ncbi:hypothetical protein F5Y19DRAFT_258973 [Xylariaceae sp. FL1651]|nr:hypothetical protein F5Y19DRAFT_258973 [Xylariaceae sp. FL1651]
MLDTLPFELLSDIAAQFCPHCREGDANPGTTTDVWALGLPERSDATPWYRKHRQPLVPLCLVSKRMRDVVQPILYHEFMPGFGDPWRTSGFVYEDRLTSFMRTAAERPELAAAVKKVYIHPHLLRTVNHDTALQVLDLINKTTGLRVPYDWPALETVVEPQEIPPWSPEEVIKLHGVRDALMHVLLLQVRNLAHLSFLGLNESLFTSISSSLSQASETTGLSLKTLDFTFNSTAYSDSPRSLELARNMISASPSLEALSFHRCTSTWHLAPYPSMTKLKALRVTQSWLGPSGLEAVLASCSGLESFTYVAAGKHAEFVPIDSAGNWHFGGTDAITYLRSHSGTLKLLHLDLNGCRYDPDAEPLVSLKDFTALEDLSISSDTIYSGQERDPPKSLLTQFLPSNIKSIRLLGKLSHFALALSKALVEVAFSVREGQFPRLRRVRCMFMAKVAESGVAELFADVGIDFGWENWPGSSTNNA